MRRYKLNRVKRIHGLHFTPCCSRLLVCGGTDVSTVGAAILLDLAVGEPQARTSQRGSCYAVPPDLSRFVLGGANRWDDELDGIVWANLPNLSGWERQRWLKRSLPPRYAGVYGLALDTSGTRLAIAHLRFTTSSSYDPRQYLTIADPNTGEAEFNLPTTRPTSVLAFCANGTRLAVTGGHRSGPGVTVFDLTSRAPLATYSPPKSETLALLFLPDSRLVVASGDTAFVLRADVKQQFVLAGHTKQVNALAVTPDGKRLLTASDDGTVRAWDLRTGDTTSVFDWKVGPVTALACAPDGLTCAAAGTGGQVVLWDADG